MAAEKELRRSVPGSETEEFADTEASDSYSSILSPQSNNQPCDGNNAASSTQKFKGVVQQQNGHWGAQIYANHQRIWLGTFKSDEEAAMAYDSAVIKLRSGDPHRNFPLNQKSREEHEFQSHLSTEAVLAMIKDGTYRDKLSEYLSTMSSDGHENSPGYPNVVLIRNPDRFSFQQLFQKELTPSDVGKLNRLVIPKKYAVKFFPRISRRAEVAGSRVEGMQLVFYDRGMRSWNFQYCYWSSSRSFVFTKGWKSFVKDKELRSGDVVGFYECLCHDQRREGKTFGMINVVRRETRNVALDGKGTVDVQMEKKNKGFKLFGVEIN